MSTQPPTHTTGAARTLLPLGTNPTIIDPERCGSAAGYSMHLYGRQIPCDACRRANADQQMQRRATNPDHRRRALIESRSSHAAATALREHHPDEYTRLKELARVRIEKEMETENIE